MANLYPCQGTAVPLPRTLEHLEAELATAGPAEAWRTASRSNSSSGAISSSSAGRAAWLFPSHIPAFAYRSVRARARTHARGRMEGNPRQAPGPRPAPSAIPRARPRAHLPARAKPVGKCAPLGQSGRGHPGFSDRQDIGNHFEPIFCTEKALSFQCTVFPAKFLHFEGRARRAVHCGSRLANANTQIPTRQDLRNAAQFAFSRKEAWNVL